MESSEKGILGKSGLTLIEVIAVVVALSIISAIAIPSILGVIDNFKKDLCLASRTQVEKSLERFMDMYDLEYSPVLFEQHLSEYDEDVCPVGGELRYVDGEVECSVHSEHVEVGAEEESVPFL